MFEVRIAAIRSKQQIHKGTSGKDTLPLKTVLSSKPVENQQKYNRTSAPKVSTCWLKWRPDRAAMMAPRFGRLGVSIPSSYLLVDS